MTLPRSQSLPSILIIQERGRHPVNLNFRECENLRRSFDRLAVRSAIWGPGYETFLTPLQSLARDYDVLFVVENYDSLNWLPDLSGFRNLKVFWSIDSHCMLHKHTAMAKRSRFDIHLNSTAQYLDHFRKYSDVVEWFPNAYPSDLIAPRDNVSFTHDVGFCGSLIRDRQRWLARIARLGLPVHTDIFVLGNAMVEAIASYRIGLNKSIADDLNFRIFETLGCGTFLLTNEVDHLSTLFTPGVHLVTYSSPKDLVMKAKHYLSHTAERTAIATAGHAHAAQHHTFDVRAQQFLKLVTSPALLPTPDTQV